jgi:hypothetical protein
MVSAEIVKLFIWVKNEGPTDYPLQLVINLTSGRLRYSADMNLFHPDLGTLL